MVLVDYIGIFLHFPILLATHCICIMNMHDIFLVSDETLKINNSNLQ